MMPVWGWILAVLLTVLCLLLNRKLREVLNLVAEYAEMVDEEQDLCDDVIRMAESLVVKLAEYDPQYVPSAVWLRTVVHNRTITRN